MCLLNPGLPTASGEDASLPLRKSVRRRGSNEIFSCSFCSFKSKYRKTLRKHVQNQHSGQVSGTGTGATTVEGPVTVSKKLKCKLCDFETTQRSSLILHNRKQHSGDKPYRCSICPYKCAKKWNLIIHTRIHTGEKPHTCPYCPFASAYSNILNKHVDQKHKDENIL